MRLRRHPGGCLTSADLTPVTSGPACLWPRLQAPVWAGSLADRGRSPHSPKLQAEPPRAPSWALERSTNSSKQWKFLWLSKARQTELGQRGTADGPPRRTSRRLYVGAVQTPPATGRPGDTDGVCAKWGRACRPPTQHRLLDPPGPQTAGSQEAGDPLPSRRGDPGGSLPCGVWVLTKGAGGPTWLPVLVTGGR